MKYTKEELIIFFKALEKELGRRPTLKDWVESDITPTRSQVRLKFKNWTEFIKEMELEPLGRNSYIGPLEGVKFKHSNGYVWVRDTNHPNAYPDGCLLEHRKVMADFLGRPLYPDEVVHHKNGVRDDNRIENLELIVNSSEHIKRHWQNAEGNFKRGEDSHRSKLNNEKVQEIRSLYTSGNHSLRELAEIHGVGVMTVWHVVKRSTWKHVE